jgi:hypothetical protein
MTSEEYLKSLHTRQLMKLRDAAYAVSDIGMDLDRVAFYNVTPTLSVSIHQIRSELNTREHVPNKIESKKIRQQTALEKKNR